MKVLFKITLFLSLALLAASMATAAAPGDTQPSMGRPVMAPSLHSRPSPSAPALIPVGEEFWSQGAAGATHPGGQLPLGGGGPDEFGYTWDDTIPLNWINATDGTDTGMSGGSFGQATGPVTLPFTFNFYEESYSSLYIAAGGYLAFSESYWSSQEPIPSPARPNSVIAPYWAPLFLNSSGLTARVYYRSGGVAPERYFVTEWYYVKGGAPSDSVGGDDTYHFEVILYENGDIVFQYQAMDYNGGFWCGAEGVEDHEGLDGLSSQPFCAETPSQRAVRFHRPAPSARVTIRPLYQGRFTRAGVVETFLLPLRNTGELGTDSYNIFPTSDWPASLYSADGVIPLADSNDDGVADTGPVLPGQTVTITIKLETPSLASVGAGNRAEFAVVSNLDRNQSKTATLQSAIAAPFIQVYQDAADGAMSLSLIQTGASALKKVTPDHYTSDADEAPTMAVTETAGQSFIYAWAKSRCLDSACMLNGSEIEYALIDRTGVAIREISQLTNHSQAVVSTFDSSPAVAAAPDGHIGLTWYRQLWDASTGQSNYNIYFAALNSDGDVAYGPLNLTNNDLWGPISNLGVPQLWQPRITATGDNHFIVAWKRYSLESGGYLSDIYYSVRRSDGKLIKAITNFSNSNVGEAFYRDPSLTSVDTDRALLAYVTSDGIVYSVLNSQGQIVKAVTTTGSFGSDPDAVQLSSGAIALAWGANLGHMGAVIQVAMLDGVTYDISAGPTIIASAAAVTGNAYVSLTADGDDHAILTWTDADPAYQRALYYALVDSSATVLSQPMIFYDASKGGASQGEAPNIATNIEGSGASSYSWPAPAASDGSVRFGADLFTAPPGGSVNLKLSYANYGTATATGAVLTATLDSRLNYVSDTSGLAPVVAQGQVTWRLPQLAFLDRREFTLTVRPSAGAVVGARYPVTLALNLAGVEANSDDNLASAEVTVAWQSFLPLLVGSR